MPILAADGVTPLAQAPPRRAGSAVMDTPFHGASPIHQDLALWQPSLTSADSELRFGRQLLVARIRDLVRNNGWADGSVSRYVDAVMGANLRLSAAPNWRALGITSDAAAELAQQMETLWAEWANDPQHRCDATRHDSFGLLAGLNFRHKVVDGEGLAVLHWDENRRWRWRTCVEVVDPDRLSNPYGQPDSDDLRQGVVLDDFGGAIAYHIRVGHPNDGALLSGDTYRWERVERETPWGRPIVLHDFDRQRAGQHRGVPRLASAIRDARMATNYASAEMQAAVVNAILAAYIESPFDHAFVGEALETNEVGTYQDAREKFHDKREIRLNGLRIPTLFPGEKVTFQTAARPGGQFEPFMSVAQRNVASAMRGQSYEQATLDWMRSNYSSARGGLAEAFRSVIAERLASQSRTVTPIYGAVMEEAFEAGWLEPPPGAPDFEDAPAAYLAGRWIGPGRGWIDPVKEAQAAQIRMETGLSTLEAEAAEQGLDWRDLIEQRKRERLAWQEAGLPDPNMAAIMSAGGGEARSDQQGSAQ